MPFDNACAGAPKQFLDFFYSTRFMAKRGVMCITVARGDETATKTPGHALCAHITRTFHDLAHSTQALLSKRG